MREGFANWADTASDYASQSADLVNNSMSGLVGNISEALAGNKVDWEDWSKSVLASMQKIILNAMIVNSLQSSMGSSGLFGGLLAVLVLLEEVARRLLEHTTQQHLISSLTQRWHLCFRQPQRAQ
jgi:phage-related minor tail protein